MIPFPLRHLLRFLLSVVPIALLALVALFWLQNLRTPRAAQWRCIFWCGRAYAYFATGPTYLRIVAARDPGPDAVQTRWPYFEGWKSTLIDDPFVPNSICFPSVVLFEDLAYASPHALPWSPEFLGLHATTGSVEAPGRGLLPLPPHLIIDFPYWMPISALSLIVILQIRRRIPALRKFLRPPGACANCGYDLRASLHRCPECGSSFSPHDLVPRQRLSLALLRIHLQLRRRPLVYAVLTFAATLGALEALFAR